METNKEQSARSLAQEEITLSSGVKLAYYDSKEAHGLDTALVLLHGYCGSSAYWEKVVDELSSTIRIIAPDARGHGLSAAPSDEIYTMESFAGDLEGLLAEIGIKQAIVLGHSLGGYIALAFADKHPDKLSAFGLVHSTPLADSDTAKENRDKAVAALETGGVSVFVDGLIPKLFAPSRIEGMKPEVDRCKEIGYGTSLHGAVATAKGMKARADRSVVIHQTKLPVLLVAGSQDGVIPPGSTFSAIGADTRKVELEEAGHMSMMECSAQLAEELASFVRSI
ncbi:alpha/beta fold hydrolase [Paenibacillus sp. GCM10027627]|uniref:alpha/beta fold hydrolase n=1 Tax=unclassified Paenibacillus TaxID=185978 RepID=UPI00362D76BA